MLDIVAKKINGRAAKLTLGHIDDKAMVPKLLKQLGSSGVCAMFSLGWQLGRHQYKQKLPANCEGLYPQVAEKPELRVLRPNMHSKEFIQPKKCVIIAVLRKSIWCHRNLVISP